MLAYSQNTTWCNNPEDHHLYFETVFSTAWKVCLINAHTT
jgi:hypothetical protein